MHQDLPKTWQPAKSQQKSQWFGTHEIQVSQLSTILSRAAATLAPVPEARRIFSRHPLMGLDQFDFSEGLTRLQQLSAGRVYPLRTDAKLYTEPGKTGFLASPWNVKASTLSNRIKRKLVRSSLAYARLLEQSKSITCYWDFIVQHWALRDAALLPYLHELAPQGPMPALGRLLQTLDIPQATLQEELEQALWLLPGWSSHWQHRGDDLTSFLALAYLYVFDDVQTHAGDIRSFTGLRAALRQESHNPQLEAQQGLDTLHRLESQLSRQVMDVLREGYQQQAQTSYERADVQAFFCIDPRCESYRTQCERQIPTWETYSCSGAFAGGTDTDAFAAATLDKFQSILGLLDTSRSMARYVLFVGHTHHHDDPWHAGYLECTACGGHSGESNARFTADTLNLPAVRQALAFRGVCIPEDTLFVPALYNSFQQRVELLPSLGASLTQKEALLSITAGLHAIERQMPYRPQIDKTKSGYSTWYPLSGGAAGNAAFFIGRRAKIRGLSLRGRSFLHSYDESQDASGTRLALILQGALQVALRINLQFYFSAVDPQVWGAGWASDLQAFGQHLKLRAYDRDLALGLPLDCLTDPDGHPHEPTRLQVFLEVREPVFQEALKLAPEFAKTFKLQWFRLYLVDPGDGSSKEVRL